MARLMTKLKSASLNPHSNQPIAELVVDGERSYLWIGNNAAGDQSCYATLHGAELRRLALAILRHVPQGRRKRKARTDGTH